MATVRKRKTDDLQKQVEPTLAHGRASRRREPAARRWIRWSSAVSLTWTRQPGNHARGPDLKMGEITESVSAPMPWIAANAPLELVNSVTTGAQRIRLRRASASPWRSARKSRALVKNLVGADTDRRGGAATGHAERKSEASSAVAAAPRRPWPPARAVTARQRAGGDRYHVAPKDVRSRPTGRPMPAATLRSHAAAARRPPCDATENPAGARALSGATSWRSDSEEDKGRAKRRFLLSGQRGRHPARRVHVYLLNILGPGGHRHLDPSFVLPGARSTGWRKGRPHCRHDACYAAVVPGAILPLMFSPAFGLGGQFSDSRKHPGYVQNVIDWGNGLYAYSHVFEDETIQSGSQRAGPAFVGVVWRSSAGRRRVGSGHHVRCLGFALAVAF
ncbi:MAG: hypothetical protein ACLSDQ_10665 [Adlercreutzia equolifaciens]